ncbi:MAG: hypothetical protein PVI30_15645 [Myxococcales bacterium]|jgi:hypothetical protein
MIDNATWVAAPILGVRPLQDEPYGMRDFTIETPDGHRPAFASEAET